MLAYITARKRIHRRDAEVSQRFAEDFRVGVAPETLRRWEAQGKIEVERTPKGHRRCDLARLHRVAPRVAAEEL